MRARMFDLNRTECITKSLWIKNEKCLVRNGEQRWKSKRKKKRTMKNVN